jgi:hypothetical protein
MLMKTIVMTMAPISKSTIAKYSPACSIYYSVILYYIKNGRLEIAASAGTLQEAEQH